MANMKRFIRLILWRYIPVHYRGGHTTWFWNGRDTYRGELIADWNLAQSGPPLANINRWNKTMDRPIRINSVKPQGDFIVELGFTDGTTRSVDLTPYLHGKIFENIRNSPAVFQSVTVDTRSGTICWANGADIDPDVLYYGLTPAWAEKEVA
jgi:hypothetical protein